MHLFRTRGVDPLGGQRGRYPGAGAGPGACTPRYDAACSPSTEPATAEASSSRLFTAELVADASADLADCCRDPKNPADPAGPRAGAGAGAS